MMVLSLCSGGIGFTGATACASGKCTFYNSYYSQV
jgi:hypothetical protein